MGRGEPAPRSGSAAKPPFIAYASLFLLGLLAAAAGQTFREYVTQWNQRELARVTSPDQRLDAVFVGPIWRYLGAGSALYVIPKGDPTPGAGGVFRGTRFQSPPELSWKNRQLLEVRYRAGCIDGFSNLWSSSEVGDGEYYVEVRLEPLSAFTCLTNPASTDADLTGK
ncbi:MAG TPA: hypothetical protein VEC38_04475 [Candidatus Binataceae bacterium]|nr:hypothetical protein [Candidatus Binataceae bacterium]